MTHQKTISHTKNLINKQMFAVTFRSNIFGSLEHFADNLINFLYYKIDTGNDVRTYRDGQIFVGES